MTYPGDHGQPPRKPNPVTYLLTGALFAVAVAAVTLSLTRTIDIPVEQPSGTTNTTAQPTTPTPGDNTNPTSSYPTTQPATQPSTTTTLAQPVVIQTVDVVVYGDSAGAVGAAVTAARQGLDVLMVFETGYVGGQMSAAGISTMDEHGSRDEVRQSGLYGELYATLTTQYGGTEPLATCYYGTGTNPFCPEPAAVQGVLQGWVQMLPNLITRSGFHAIDVIQDGNTVTGLMLIDDAGNRYDIHADVTIDGSEMATLYPMIEGLEYSVGNGACVQKTTWSIIRKLYVDGLPDELTPPADTKDVMTAYYGADIVDGWLNAFRTAVNYDGYSTFPGWNNNPRGQSWSPEVERGYRMMADNHSGLNNGPVDQPISAAAMADPTSQQATNEYLAAKDRSWLYLWYEFYELGVTDWGLADDQGYRAYDQSMWSDNIPDEYEQHFPLIPYVRERARIEGVDRMTWDQVYDRANVPDFDDSVLIGGYMTDQHGCQGPEQPLIGEQKWSDFFSTYGAYEVPIGVFVPATIDGFMPGIVAGSSVDRLVAGSLRMQPQELLGGQVVGTIATLAVREGTLVRNVEAEQVRALLVEQGVIVDG